MPYEDWASLLKEVIRLHYFILKPGGFLIINIADISFGSLEQQLLIATSLLLRSGGHGGRERYGTYSQYEPMMTTKQNSR